MRAFFVVTTLASLALAGSAQPAAGREGAVRCEEIGKFTTDWFLRNTKPEHSGNLHETGLFYSRGMSAKARDLGKMNSKVTTIWDVWPCYLYNHHDIPSNPLRCIHANQREQLQFFENMSRAFAIKARSFARVLHSVTDYPRPPMDGIWGRVELPEIMRGGQVDLLQKLSEDMSLSEIFWRRLKDLTEQLPSLPKLELKKRGWSWGSEDDSAPEGASCMPLRDYEKFDRLPW